MLAQSTSKAKARGAFGARQKNIAPTIGSIARANPVVDCPELWIAESVLAEVIVSTEVDEAFLLTWTRLGLKEQDNAAGKFEQASCTAPKKPLLELTVMVAVPVPPEEIVIDDGLAPTVKAGVACAAVVL